MGLISRDALVEVGGWDEWCITEDAELSLRLLRAGWSGTHVEHAFGRGIMPLTFEALKRQRFRWCFGGVQLLRMASALAPNQTEIRLHLAKALIDAGEKSAAKQTLTELTSAEKDSPVKAEAQKLLQTL